MKFKLQCSQIQIHGTQPHHPFSSGPWLSHGAKWLWQRWTTWAAKPEILTNWPFTEKFAASASGNLEETKRVSANVHVETAAPVAPRPRGSASCRLVPGSTLEGPTGDWVYKMQCKPGSVHMPLTPCIVRFLY